MDDAATREQELRREHVAHLLERGSFEKLLKGGTREARTVLERARTLAHKSPRLPWPFPQLASYRLAYLCARSATGRDDLERILSLLDEAEAERALDPLQYALEIVVADRLVRIGAQSASTRIDVAYRKLLHAADAARRQARQNDLFNLIELLAIATGRDYADLEGDGAILDAIEPRHNRAYLLAGTQGISSNIRMSLSFAEGEIAARIASGSVDLAFRWTRDEPPSIIFPVERPLPVTAATRLVTALVAGGVPSAALGDVKVASHFKMGLKAVREVLADALATTGSAGRFGNVIVFDKSTSMYRFAEGLRAVGLFESDVWREGEREKLTGR